MGVKKKWYWDKEDWDKRIREQGLLLDASDIPLMNASEMSQILNLVGVRAHREMPLEDLRFALTALHKGEPAPPFENPVDKKRDVLIAFMKKNEEKIRDQLLSHCIEAGMDCYKHSDMMVTACYQASRKVLEEDNG